MKKMKNKDKNENWIAKMDMAAADKQAAEANRLQDAELAKTWKPKTQDVAFKEATISIMKSKWFKTRPSDTGVWAHNREVDGLEQAAILDGMAIGWRAAMRLVQENSMMRRRIARIANLEAKEKQDQLKVKKVNFKG